MRSSTQKWQIRFPIPSLTLSSELSLLEMKIQLEKELKAALTQAKS